MLRGLFREKTARVRLLEDRLIEATLVDFTGPHLAMDWDFYFCTLQTDKGERIPVSIRDWDNSLKVGQRVQGYIGRGIFTGHQHIDVLEPASSTSPAALFRRLRGMIGRMSGQ